MRPRRPKARRARTLAGEVAFERPVWECPRCRAGRAPLDEELGLAKRSGMTRRLERKIAFEGARDSFAEASKALEHQLEIEVSPAEVARVVEEAGERLDERQRERENRWNEPVGGDGKVAAPEFRVADLVVQVDATSVLTVKEQEHKMVWCATAFALEWRTRKDGSLRPMLVDRRYTASSGSFEDLKPRVLALMHRLGVRGARRVAFVGDGATCLWDWAKDRVSRAVLIQDYWHVVDRLAGLAKALLPGAEAAAECLAWWKAALTAGRVGDILEDLGRQSERATGERAERLRQEIGYLENGAARMDYARFREQGWLVGSGAVEGTCKNLVKKRYNLAGARWKRERIHQVLALRLSIFNEEWEGDWEHETAA